DELDELRDRLQKDERAAELRAELVAWIDAEDPTFFPRFAESIQSGDHFEIDASVGEAGDLLTRAIAARAESDGIVGADQISSGGAPQGFIIGKILVALAAAAFWAGAYYDIVVVVSGWFWGGGSDPDKGAIGRERAIDLIATRLA